MYRIPKLTLIGLSAAALGACSGSTNGPSHGAPSTSSTATDSGTCPRVASSTKPCPDIPDPCNLKSGFEGDEYCMAAPPADKGIQIHFGPSNYTDTTETAKYTLAPGEEFNAYGIASIGTAEDKWYNRVTIHMRPGSHHLINTVVTGDNLPVGFSTGGCPGTQIAGFPGTQNLVYDSPPQGIPAPENVGMGGELPGNASLCLNYHAYNTTNITHLREVWMNVYFVDASEVTQKEQSVFVLAGPFQGIPPGTKTELKASADITEDGRIVSLFGHRHVYTDRFAVWKNEELVYDSWSWQEAAVFDYDSITNNPAPNPTAKTDGAVSGDLDVKAGDKVSIECDVNNTSSQTLTFKNELYGGEMCILFGSSLNTSVRSVGGVAATPLEDGGKSADAPDAN
ncbi:MAG TPA: hypothetical protein VH142_06275 [Polyangiaceae bacterium]|jgi:hypothetical protein|nr:hypothetical protein [Polyangiaceae bacterium]